MTAPREAILNRLRAAKAVARLPSIAAIEPPVTVSHQEPEARRFQREAELLGVECFIEGTDDAVCARVMMLLAGERVLAWDPERLPYGLGAAVPDTASGRSPRSVQAAASIGLTGCDGAIAETASLAMLNLPGQPRTASLLPPVHVAVVKRCQIVPSMADFLTSHRDHFERGAGCTFITGPSRTADIELTLTLGIHGPGRLIIIIGP